MLTLFDPETLDLDTWTAIAERPRHERGRWKPVKDAPLSLREVQRLRDQRAIVQALKFEGETEVVVVKSARRSSSNP